MREIAVGGRWGGRMLWANKGEKRRYDRRRHRAMDGRRTEYMSAWLIHTINYLFICLCDCFQNDVVLSRKINIYGARQNALLGHTQLQKVVGADACVKWTNAYNGSDEVYRRL